MFKHLTQPGFYEQLEAKLAKLLTGLQQAADDAGIAFKTQAVGGMFGLYFTNSDDLSSFEAMTHCNIEAFKQFFHGMLKRGVYLAPSAFEAGFISSVHSDADIEKTISIARDVFNEMAA